MISKYKKIAMSALTAIICIAVLLAGIFIIRPTSQTAEAATSINEIYNSENKTFVKSELEALYTALGSSNGYDDVKLNADNKKASAVPKGGGSTLTGDNTVANRNITVTFGGKQWYAVYLSESDSNDVVLTLWAKTVSTETTKWNLHTNVNVNYPSGMYSSSKIRSFLTGSTYSTDGTTLDATAQSPEWRNFFTGLGGADNYSKFLVQPKNMGWQYDERGYDIFPSSVSWGSNASGNEAQSGATVSAAVQQVITNIHYNDWREDYIFEPGVTETGNLRYKPGIWKCLDAQYKTSTDYWMRSTTTGDSDMTHYNTSGNHKYDKVNFAEKAVRPALHLNLTEAEKISVETYAAPEDITMTYAAEEFDIAKAFAANKASWYDSAKYTDVVDIDYNSQTLKNVGTYPVKLTIKPEAEVAWSDSNGVDDKERTINFVIEPAPITVTIPESGDFKKSNDYVYHTDGSGKHALKFPESEYSEETRTMISLLNVATAEDKGSLRIFYIVETHPEDGHEDFDADEHKPNESDGRWKEYSADNAELNVNEPKGYCVYYKITANNHKAEIGYFSVHIVSEILTITMSNYTLDNKIYGEAPHTQEDLYDLFKERVEDITDQNGEPRKEELQKPENVAKFRFYFTENADGSGDMFKTEDDSGGTARWNVGKYYLQARYTAASESYISFKWNDGSVGQHPSMTIEPKEVSLVWEGNGNWDSDKSKVSTSVAEGTMTAAGVFNYVYAEADGAPVEYVPKAYFVDLNGAKVYVKIDGAKSNANMGTQTHKATAKAQTAEGDDIKNYTFASAKTDETRGGTERDFRINKAKNEWVERFFTNTLTIGDNINEKIIEPKALFGECRITYYTSEADRSSKSNPTDYPTQEEGDYFVRVLVEDTSNYDGLDSIDDADFTAQYAFRVSGCNHVYTLWQADPDDSSRHFRTCETCGETFYEAHSPKLKGGTTEVDYKTSADEHWAECKDCHAEILRAAHGSTSVKGVEPTCTESGRSEEIKCPDCGKVIVASQPIAALGHKFGDDMEVEEATCTQDGFRRGTCIRDGCETGFVYETIKATGHTKIEHPAKDPTETEAGNIQYWTCTVCQKLFGSSDNSANDEITLQSTVIPALGLGGGTGGGSGGGIGGNVEGNGGVAGNGEDVGNFFRNNWWWIAIIAGAILLIILLIVILSLISWKRQQRLQRERDRQFDALLKMQMMHYGFGAGGFAGGVASAPDGATPVEGQAPPQLPFTQEMFDAAVTAAVSSALKAIRSGDDPTAGNASSQTSGERAEQPRPARRAASPYADSPADSDGFYDDYDPNSDSGNNGNGGNGGKL